MWQCRDADRYGQGLNRKAKLRGKGLEVICPRDRGQECERYTYWGRRSPGERDRQQLCIERVYPGDQNDRDNWKAAATRDRRRMAATLVWVIQYGFLLQVS